MKQKQMFFWNSLAFSIIQQMMTIWYLIPLLPQNPACTCESSWFTYCFGLIWRILSIPLLVYEMNIIVWFFDILWHSHSSGLKWKLTFSSPVATAGFSIFANSVECSTLTALSFTILNNSTVIPSHALGLFIVMLPKAHLTSHSWMSSCRWVTTTRGCLDHEDLFHIVLLCILATSS